MPMFVFVCFVLVCFMHVCMCDSCFHIVITCGRTSACLLDSDSQITLLMQHRLYM